MSAPRQFVLRIGGTVETAGLYLKICHPSGRAVEREFATAFGSKTSAYRAKRDEMNRWNRNPAVTLSIEEIPPAIGTGPFEIVKPQPAYIDEVVS